MIINDIEKYMNAMVFIPPVCLCFALFGLFSTIILKILLTVKALNGERGGCRCNWFLISFCSVAFFLISDQN